MTGYYVLGVTLKYQAKLRAIACRKLFATLN